LVGAKAASRRLAGWRVASLIVLTLASIGAFALAGCERGGEQAVTVTVTAPADETRPLEERDLRDVTKLVEGPLSRSASGHLAYVGSDENVYVVDPLSGATVQVTSDRSSGGTGFGIFHTGLAWSRSGQLAFARTDIDSFTSSLFMTVPGSGKVTRLAPEGGMLIYASWSPAKCAESACNELAYIADVDREPGGNVSLKVIDVPAHASPRPMLEQEAEQIYFSWTGDPGRIIRHVLDRRTRLEEVDVAAGSSRAIRGPFAPFLAPAYAAGRVVYAVAGPSDAEPRVTVSRSAVVVHVPRGSRRVVFAPSPDGHRLAFAVRGRSQLTPPQAFEEPWIADVETGELMRVGPPSLWSEAFYWSPDGERLAYLTWLDNDFRQFNQWRIFDVAAQKDTGSLSFQPTSTFDTLTTFFDQFGQSHSLWSPDSRYLTYAAVGDDGREQIWLLDTRRSASPLLVADGVVGIFSWR
jgi:TolB protein